MPCDEGVPTLFDLSFRAVLSLCCSSSCPDNLQGLPEEVVSALFEGVLEAGKLTPRSLAAFVSTGHDAVRARIEALRIREPPPVVLADTTASWLGDERRRW